MQYKEYPQHSDTYIVIHNTGFGVMEDPYTEQKVAYTAKTLKEAQKQANLLKIQNNTPEEIASSWVPNTYHININTCTPQGKLLLQEFSDNFDQRFDAAEATGSLKKYKIGDMDIFTIPNSQFDEPELPTRIVWSEPKLTTICTKCGVVPTKAGGCSNFKEECPQWPKN